MARSVTSSLFKAARTSASIRSVTTGHAGRRVKNVAVGRALGRAGVWGKLWR